METILKIMYSDPEAIQLQDKVLILYPSYVAGFEGTILSQESLCGNKIDKRWLIIVNLENFILSLAPQDFIVLKDNQHKT